MHQLSSVATVLLLALLLPSRGEPLPLRCDKGLAHPPSGSVLSDPSGSIRLSSYENQFHCSWTVQCPEDRTVFSITELSLSTERGYDWVRLRKPETSGVFDMYTQFSGVHLGIKAFSDSSTVGIEFVSDYSVVPKSAFFNLSYSCVPVQCRPSLLSPNWINCTQYPLKCPLPDDPANAGSKNVPWRNDIWNSFALVTPAEDLPKTGFLQGPNGVPLGSQRLAPGSPISYTAPSSSVSHGATNALFQQYTCQLTRCHSPNASIVAINMTKAGTNSSSLAASMSDYNICRWDIECPAGENVFFWNVRVGGVDVNYSPGVSPQNRDAQLIFGDQLSGAVLWKHRLPATTIAQTAYPRGFLSKTNNVFVSFQALEANGSFSFDFQCIVGRCLMDPPAQNIIAGPQSEEVSFVTRHALVVGEQCDWTIDCGCDRVVSLRAVYSLWSPFAVRDAATGQLLIELLKDGALDSRYFVTNSRAVSLTYNGSDTNGADDLYPRRPTLSVGFKCLALTCESVERTATTICSIFPDNSCQSAEYPAPDTVNNLHMPPSSSIAFVNPSTNNTIVSYRPHTSSMASAASPETYLKVSWTLPTTLVEGNHTPRFSVSYACDEHTCKVGAPSGSLFAPPSGAGREPINSSSSGGTSSGCRWIFQCPLGKAVVVSTNSLHFHSSAYSFLSPYSTVLPYQPSDWVTNENMVTVLYHPAAGARIPPAPEEQFSWYCGTAHCASVNASNTVYRRQEGRLVTGVDGGTSGGNRCLWTIECAVGTVFSITMMNFSTMDEGVFFRILSQKPSFSSASGNGSWEGVLLVVAEADNLESMNPRGLVTSAPTVYISLETPPTHSLCSFVLDWKCISVTYARPSSPPSPQEPLGGTVRPVCATTTLIPRSFLPLTAQVFNSSDDAVRARFAYSFSVDDGISSSMTVWPTDFAGGSFSPSGVGFTRKGTPIRTSSLPPILPSSDNNTAVVQFLLSYTSDIAVLHFLCPPSATNNCVPEGDDGPNLLPNPMTASRGTLYRYEWKWNYPARITGARSCVRMVSCPLGHTLQLLDYRQFATSRQSISAWANGLELDYPTRFALTRGVSMYKVGAPSTLRYACLRGSCSSPNTTGSIFTAPQGRITSGSPSDFGFGYVIGGQCQWTVQCPLNTIFTARVNFTREISWYDGVRLTFYDTTLTHTGSSSGGDDRRYKMVAFDAVLSAGTIVSNASAVQIEFRAPGDTYTRRRYSPDDGFDIQYECLPVSCQSEDADPRRRVACNVSLPQCNAPRHRRPLFELFYGPEPGGGGMNATPSEVVLFPSGFTYTTIDEPSGNGVQIPVPTDGNFSRLTFRGPVPSVGHTPPWVGYVLVYRCSESEPKTTVSLTLTEEATRSVTLSSTDFMYVNFALETPMPVVGGVHRSDLLVGLNLSVHLRGLGVTIQPTVCHAMDNPLPSPENWQVILNLLRFLNDVLAKSLRLSEEELNNIVSEGPASANMKRLPFRGVRCGRTTPPDPTSTNNIAPLSHLIFFLVPLQTPTALALNPQRPGTLIDVTRPGEAATSILSLFTPGYVVDSEDVWFRTQSLNISFAPPETDSELMAPFRKVPFILLAGIASIFQLDWIAFSELQIFSSLIYVAHRDPNSPYGWLAVFPMGDGYVWAPFSRLDEGNAGVWCTIALLLSSPLALVSLLWLSNEDRIGQFSEKLVSFARSIRMVCILFAVVASFGLVLGICTGSALATCCGNWLLSVSLLLNAILASALVFGIGKTLRKRFQPEEVSFVFLPREVALVRRRRQSMISDRLTASERFLLRSYPKGLLPRHFVRTDQKSRQVGVLANATANYYAFSALYARSMLIGLLHGLPLSTPIRSALSAVVMALPFHIVWSWRYRPIHAIRAAFASLSLVIVFATPNPPDYTLRFFPNYPNDFSSSAALPSEPYVFLALTIVYVILLALCFFERWVHLRLRSFESTAKLAQETQSVATVEMKRYLLPEMSAQLGTREESEGLRSEGEEDDEQEQRAMRSQPYDAGLLTVPLPLEERSPTLTVEREELGEQQRQQVKRHPTMDTNDASRGRCEDRSRSAQETLNVQQVGTNAATPVVGAVGPRGPPVRSNPDGVGGGVLRPPRRRQSTSVELVGAAGHLLEPGQTSDTANRTGGGDAEDILFWEDTTWNR